MAAIDCKDCNRSGVVGVVIGGDSLDGLKIQKKHTISLARILYKNAIPCHCPYGDNMREKFKKRGSERLQMPRAKIKAIWQDCVHTGDGADAFIAISREHQKTIMDKTGEAAASGY